MLICRCCRSTSKQNQAGFSEENPAWFFVYETAVFAVLHLGSAGAGDGDAGAEWTQGKLCKLKALHPNRYPDNGDTPDTACKDPR